MILKDAEAVEYLRAYQKPPKWVEEARKEHKRLKAIVNGENFKEHLIRKIEKIESDDRKKARDNFSRSIKDTVHRMLKPFENVYTATGGTKSYQIKNEESFNNYVSRLRKIRDGKPIEQWLSEHWIKDLYVTDPNGVIFLEYLGEEKIYPTYKSILSIRAYEAKGQKLEWIIFEPERVKTEAGGQNVEFEMVRIVDDLNDRKYIKRGDEYTLLENSTFQHPFQEVPGLINSPRVKLGKELRLSPLDDVVEEMEEYARDQSVLSLYKYTKLFPIFWRYKMLCPDCEGSGKIDGNICTTCDGEGYLGKRDVTDEVSLPIPESANEPQLAPDIAGFISPDLETAEYYRGELNNSEIRMYETLWGSHKTKIEGNTNNKTAFEVWMDSQPVMNTLEGHSKIASFMEETLSEWVARWEFPGRDKDEKVAHISYGTNFIIDPPDAILERYNSNREKGAPVVILDRMLREYITSKYKSNPGALRFELLKKRLEPYIHYTVQEVRETFGKLEAQKKILFTDWWETIQQKDVEKFKILTLERKRDEYIEERLKRQPIEQQELN